MSVISEEEQPEPVPAMVARLGFVLCHDGRFRRVDLHDSLVIECDEFGIGVCAETDDSAVRIPFARCPLDGVRFEKLLKLIDGVTEADEVRQNCD